MNTQRSRPFISMIWPRSEAGSVTMTTLFSLPLDSTRYLRVSLDLSASVVAMLTSTWKPSTGNLIWSAFSTMACASASTASWPWLTAAQAARITVARARRVLA